MPFHLLGKHTAYAITLDPADFAAWDAALTGLKPPEGMAPVSMTDMVMANLDVYRSDNPEKFYELYGVPSEKQKDGEWFANMSEVRAWDQMRRLRRLGGKQQ